MFGFRCWYCYTVFLNVPRDAQQCFTLIHNSVKDTIAEPYFLSILQHLLCIRDDMYSRSVQARLLRSFNYHVFTITIKDIFYCAFSWIHFFQLCFRPQYYKLIEECVTQIVLHRNGADPDFRHTKRFEIDVEPLLSKFQIEFLFFPIMILCHISAYKHVN